MPKDQVIVLTHEFAPFHGGAGIYAQEIAAAIWKMGREVSVWAPDYDGAAPEKFPFPVIRLRTSGTLHPVDFCRWTLAIWLRRRELAVATIIVGSVGAHLALMILTLFGVKTGNVVSVLHGSEIFRFELPFWRSLARRFFRQRVQRTATVSNFCRDLIVRSGLVDSQAKILLAPGAGSSAATCDSPERQSPDSRLRILTLARIHPRKGQLDVVRALALLPLEWREKVIYQIAGRGDAGYRSKIEKAGREGGVAIEFLGEISRDELPAIYRKCDTFAMTSRRLPRSVEGLGLAYLEAGFHGKPVLAYSSGGASEAVIDKGSGLLVPEGDLPALAAALLRLIVSPELREGLGRGGKENAARFSWEKSACVLLGLPCNSPSSPPSSTGLI